MGGNYFFQQHTLCITGFILDFSLNTELMRETNDIGADGYCASASATGGVSSPGPSAAPHDPEYHRHDEQVNIQLEPGSASLEPLSSKYLRLSSRATVTHLRKYVAQQVLRDISRFRDVSFLCVLFQSVSPFSIEHYGIIVSCTTMWRRLRSLLLPQRSINIDSVKPHLVTSYYQNTAKN